MSQIITEGGLLASIGMAISLGGLVLFFGAVIVVLAEKFTENMKP